jgi:hypothetical protein
MHAPSPVHVDQADHCPVLLSHVRVCVPQLPHGCDDAPGHVWLVHAPQVHCPTHACVPPFMHDCVLPSMRSPCPVQVPQVDHWPVVLSHVRVCVPQLPHACDDAPVHGMLPHAPHLQSWLHDCIPPAPQACEAPLAHSPSPEQADQADHVPPLHMRDCVPQLPHVCDDGPLQLPPESPPMLDPVSAPESFAVAPESFVLAPESFAVAPESREPVLESTLASIGVDPSGPTPTSDPTDASPPASLASGAPTMFSMPTTRSHAVVSRASTATPTNAPLRRSAIIGTLRAERDPPTAPRSSG